ncbi:GrpB family protein [Altererythrobacter endophyticus]|uniref:GrpB family protein n=2 Tax=Altericroceibacterium endophyticum TaxID=1808508 RepID=A0A6I4T5F9_9SPHN|nr:GrpB family protein [Altericroceibacterium endophyticum]MXO65381.1 GrpB family protein [Altericroceibacterium endophyticum]
MHGVLLHPYQDDWPQRFIETRKWLRRVAPPEATIHHIGSTAVPGLAGKDVIDIQISVDTLDQVEPDDWLELGFQYRAGLSDHMPPGRQLPEEELVKYLFCYQNPRINVHIRERGRFNQRFALLNRDYLRSHQDVAAAYGAFKAELADHFPDDATSYSRIKDPVFDIMMGAANHWAKETGWQEPPED